MSAVGLSRDERRNRANGQMHSRCEHSDFERIPVHRKLHETRPDPAPVQQSIPLCRCSVRGNRPTLACEPLDHLAHIIAVTECIGSKLLISSLLIQPRLALGGCQSVCFGTMPCLAAGLEAWLHDPPCIGSRSTRLTTSPALSARRMSDVIEKYRGARDIRCRIRLAQPYRRRTGPRSRSHPS